MAEMSARALGEDDWQVYRDIRLAALQDSPEAFVANYADESDCGEDYWRQRMQRAHRLVAERDDVPVGVLSLGLHHDDADIGEVFGLWSRPDARGSRIAWNLVAAAAQQAADDGRSKLYFWVGSENAPAIGFASSFGFRPTSERRETRVTVDAEAEGDEVAMVLPLSSDPTSVENPYIP